MRITLLTLIMTVLSLLPARTARLQDSTNRLPSDLIFTTGNAVGDMSWTVSDRNVLARVDAETLEVEPFYYDEKAKLIKAIRWSPQGDLLAVYLQFLSSDSSGPIRNQLCLVDRSGVLRTCFDDAPPIYGIVENYAVSWSADSQKIYFVAGRQNGSQEEYALVEADVNTGRTLRIVYAYPYEINLGLSWTPTLSHVITNIGAFVEKDLPRLLINLDTGQSIDLKDVVPEPAILSSVCPQFSPKGTYAAIKAETFNENMVSHKKLILLDKNGHVHLVIEEFSGSGPMEYLGCPVWQENEEAFYLIGITAEGYESYVFRYSLREETSAPYYAMGVAHLDTYKAIFEPLVLSPDGTHIAGTTPFNDKNGGGDQVIVLCPDGEVEYFSLPYSFALYPIWVPPAKGETQ